MNKTTKSIKDLKETIIFEIGPPLECRVCGYDIEHMKEDYEVAWLEFRIPNSNFVFYVCPNCHVCSGNQHAVENAKKIREQQDEAPPMILQPNKSIILPGRN